MHNFLTDGHDVRTSTLGSVCINLDAARAQQAKHNVVTCMFCILEEVTSEGSNRPRVFSHGSWAWLISPNLTAANSVKPFESFR